MLHINSLDEGLKIFKALGSDIRINIIKQLQKSNGMTMKELAQSLHITNGALTSHVKQLEECNLIKVTTETTTHGNTKKCNVYLDKILIDIGAEVIPKNVYKADIQVGHYSDFEVLPTCGLATEKAIIGEVDDPRYFAHPDRYDTQILWFTKGYVEYAIHNFIPTGHKIDQITLAAELSSEAPGSNESWPSDVDFYLNDVWIGRWVSPGDFGGIKGIFTPNWWDLNWNQYGLLKQIVLNNHGTFVDGLKISDVTIGSFSLDYRSNIKFRFQVHEDSEHVGGLTIFGKNFGNYNQDIEVRLEYSAITKSN